MLKYITYGTVPEIFCFLIAFITLIRDKDSAWRSLIIFYFLTCLTEFLGIYIRTLPKTGLIQFHSNIWVYNIFSLFEIIFINLMFYKIFEHYNVFRLIIKVLGLFSVNLFFIEIIINNIYNDLIFTPVITDLLFSVFSFSYFYLMMKDDEFINLKFHAPFWWVTGTLISYFGSTTQDIILVHLSDVKFILNHQLQYIFDIILSLISYGCWSYSFICRKWLMKIY